MPEAAAEHLADDDLAEVDESATSETADDDELQLPLRVSPTLDLTPFVNARSALLAGIDLTGVRRMLETFNANLVPDLKKMIIPVLDVGVLIPDTSMIKALTGLDRPLVDVQALLPRIDFTPFLRDLQVGLPDLKALMPKFDFGADFVAMLESMRRKLPPNWTEAVGIEQALDVILEDGLPLVWVPRADIVAAVLAADDRAGRVGVLIEALPDIACDCEAVLTQVEHSTLHGQVPLAMKAVAALRDGHHEAAHALAVVVTENAVARALGRDYKKVKEQVLFDPELVSFTRLRLRAALAPIGPFYTAWWPSSGDHRPEALSRHVSVHQADEDHHTIGNAVIAVMLTASVLRALQELLELADAADGDLEETA